MKKRDLLILIILIVIIVLFGYITIRFNSLKEEIDNNIIVIDMVDNNNLSLKKDTKIKLNINLFDNNLISGNKLYKWKSSDKDIAAAGSWRRNTLLDVSWFRLRQHKPCPFQRDELDVDAAFVPFRHSGTDVSRMALEADP